MEIQDIRNNKLVCFRDIKTGECFVSGDSFYMKVNTVGCINSVDVECGRLISFAESAMVFPVSAKLVISHKEYFSHD